MTIVPLRLLLVEDEALIAMMAEDLVEALGHQIVVTAATRLPGRVERVARNTDPVSNCSRGYGRSVMR